MPKPAQDRVRRGPFAALLILLGLFLTSGPSAAAGFDLRAPTSRLGSSRPGAAAALLPSGARNPLDDEASGAGAGPTLLPFRPVVVTERLAGRPSAEAGSEASAAAPRPPSASYRARAPPAA